MADRPKVGDKVYSYRRFHDTKGQQPNGKITAVLEYDDPGDYLVEFFDEPRVTTDNFSGDEMEYNSMFGGTWTIQ